MNNKYTRTQLRLGLIPQVPADSGRGICGEELDFLLETPLSPSKEAKGGFQHDPGDAEKEKRIASPE